MIEPLKHTFRQLFKKEPFIVFAPGRINIIGEHTDYNDGYVLPAAIDKGIYIAANRNADDQVNLYSIDYQERYTCSIAEVSKTEIHWVNYVLGAIVALQQQGHHIQGFNAVITSNLPVGAGVSSSAALTSATIFSLNQLFSLGVERVAMARLAQQVEHQFAGVNCGIMDMFTSLMGKENHAIQLDCRDLNYNYVPIDLDAYTFVLMNTHVAHSLASTAYNQRRKECEEGVALVKLKYPEVHSLRDVSLAMLNECIPVTSVIYKRCVCVVNQIAKVISAVDAISKKDVAALGTLLYEAHDELSHLYEVSCIELDYLVNAVQPMEGVIGARMMGGGFGGCTINLIHKDYATSIINTVKRSYEADCKLPFSSFIVSLGDGVKLISN